MHRNKIISAILLVGLITGCSNTNTNQSVALQAEDYAAILPYETSDTRVKHIGLISDQEVRIQVEQGLMDLSKDYFSPNDVGYKTHVFLDFDELDATDGSRGLLGTVRDDNPNGLNPSSDEEFDTGNGIVTQALILADIYELDWYQNDNLVGISLALVVNDELDYNNQTYTIADEQMKNYIEVTSSKLVSYMRERFNEITTRIPIYVATYKLNHSSSDSKGGYIYAGYFSGSQGKYNSINEQWVTFPSTDASTLDAQTASEFNSFKESIENTLADHTYVVGEAKYENDEIVKLNLTITAHGKTVGEILAVSQAAKESLSLFTNTDCSYLIEIYNDNTVYGMIHRSANSTEPVVISKI